MPRVEVVSPEVVARQNALFDLHRRWTRQQMVKGDVPFNPSAWPDEESVYNLHAVDLEASGEALDEFHAAARRIMMGGTD